MSPVAGTVERGKIVEEPYTVQERVYAPNKPNHGDLKFYDDGNPMWQLVIKIQTDHRDPEDPTDEGVRAIFVKGQLKAALKDAIRSSGAKKLEVGGMLAVKFVEQIINKDGFKQNIFACQCRAFKVAAGRLLRRAPSAQSTSVDSAGNIGNTPAGTGGMLGALKQQAASQQPRGERRTRVAQTPVSMMNRRSDDMR